MAIASGWRREDAVVSGATRRLENWVASPVWSSSEVDEGTPLLAGALAALLGARAVLLLVYTSGNAWQPVALAHSGEQAATASSVTSFSREENSPRALGVPLERLQDGASGPLLRDDWDAANADFAAGALALVRDELAEPGAAEAPAPGLEKPDEAAASLAASGAAANASGASGASGPSGASGASSLADEAQPVRSGARESSTLSSSPADAAEAGSLGGSSASTWGVLDSGNSVLDFVAQGAGGWDWRGEAPSLLMLLPSSSGPDGAGGQAGGAVLAWIESEDGRLSDEWRPLWGACAAQAGAWLEGALRLERVGRSYRDLAHLAARVVDVRDVRRVGHGPLVAHTCALMARSLELSEREVEEWEMAGLLHGIGRVPIPDALLQKQGALSPEERDAIRASMQAGAQWLGEVEGWASVARIVKHAGERWDGHGYPDGLEGEAIPLGSRALAIAQRFAALSQARPDRGALGSFHNVGAALESESGRALDPRLITVFQRALRGGAW